MSRLVPNAVNLMALCFGLTSIKLALVGKWELAVACILISCFLDGIDGRLARLLNATSPFGAQLDSLSDFVNFGICPALITYLWTIKIIPTGNVTWAAVLFYAICCAIRLARFNVSLDTEDEMSAKLNKMFFIGVPSPTGSLLALLPLMIQFEIGGTFDPKINLCVLVIVGFLMASRVPTFSGKKIAINPKMVWLVMLSAGFILGMLIMEPWITISVFLCLYLVTIPFSIKYYYKIKNSHIHE
ncbi:MAG: phosphatidylcholine/phosphatidylserine synthase [Alphaproteobacteria bacterium]|nr:phosphatidylcholine/phosphatidylserine synthase [Alphaproteobacteria bacterium]